jgi:3-hydroxyisobutyrate dehydrogenase
MSTVTETQTPQDAAPLAETILFVGLGNMGWPMASNVVQDGRTVYVVDSDRDREKKFAQDIGGHANADAAQLSTIDAVVLMLPTSAIVRDVLLNPDTGLAKSLPSGAVIVDMSSSDPTDTIALTEDLRPLGLHVVDAPVSGGVPRATAGTLSIMLGANDEESAVIAVDVIAPMSDKVFRTGAVGTGHAAKALNNYVAGASFAAGAEALIIGKHYGLDHDVIVDVINASTGRSFSTENVLPQIVSEKFHTGFALGLLAKDVKIADQLAERAGVQADICRSVSTRLADASTALGFGADHSAAYTFWNTQTTEQS